MPYVLEAITATDQGKIIQDAAADVEKWKQLSIARKFDDFTPNWAINRDRNCYLLRMPYPAREEINDAPFYAFVDGRMYRINRVGQTGSEVYFDEPSLPSQEVLAVAEAEITAAFSVYGMFGVGPLNRDGYPTLRLVPVFTKKGA